MNRAIQSLFKFQTNLASMPIARHFAFQSDLSTATLYPNSKQRLYTPPLSAVSFVIRKLPIYTKKKLKMFVYSLANKGR